MYLPVCCANMGLIGGVLFPGKIRNPSSGFFYDQEAGSTVPGLQLVFIETVKTACGHPAKVHRRGTQPSDGDAAADQSCKYLQRPVWLIKVSIRKTRHETGFLDIRLFAYADQLVVQCGAITFLGKKEFVYKRIVNRTQYHYSFLFQADGYATKR